MKASHISGCATIPNASKEGKASLSVIDRLSRIYSDKWTVEDRRLCSYIPAAVVLKTPRSTEQPARKKRWRAKKKTQPAMLEIEIVYLPEASRTTSSSIEAAIWKAKSYYLDARECRSPRRRNSRIRDIFSLLVNLLIQADAAAMPGYKPERTGQALPRLNDELRGVGAEVGRSLSIEARHSYLIGMFIGAVILGGGVSAIASVVPNITHVHLDTLGLGTVLAGGIGAVLSVMTRLTANNLRIDPGVGRRLVLIAGGFRPLIGGIFAFAVYVFVQGGLLPIRVTAIGLKATYFFLGVAFLAGFSERFAQDAVTRAGSVIADTGALPSSGNPAQE